MTGAPRSSPRGPPPRGAAPVPAPPTPSPAGAARIGAQRGDALRQAARIEFRLRQQLRRSRVAEEARIGGLVIIDGLGQRHEDRRPPAGGEFRHGQRAGAADHEVRPGIGSRHVIDERRRPACPVAMRGIGAARGGEVIRPHWCHHSQCAPRRAGNVAGSVSLRAPAPRLPPRTSTCRGRPPSQAGSCRRRQFRAHRIAEVAGLRTPGEDAGKARGDTPGQGRQGAVGAAGHGVLLLQEQGSVQQPGRYRRRERGVAADTPPARADAGAGAARLPAGRTAPAAAAPTSCCTTPLPRRPRIGSVCRSMPAAGTTRASSPRRVPIQHRR
jgi:hypothetical protein